MNKDTLLKYVLRLADNAFIYGHKMGELCSKGPFLEEDIAMTNIALDFIGQSSALYKYAAEIEGKGRTEDDMVYKRAERDFYNHLITEIPNGDFGAVMSRLYLLSVYHIHLFEALSKSKDETIAGVAAKSLKEVKYHLRHSSSWMLRLGDGTNESHERVQNALNEIWMYTGELFEMDAIDEEILKEGIGPDLKSIYSIWKKEVAALISEATLKLPEDGYMQTGSRKGLHTEYLGFLLTDIQYLQRAYPDAKW